MIRARLPGATDTRDPAALLEIDQVSCVTRHQSPARRRQPARSQGARQRSRWSWANGAGKEHRCSRRDSRADRLPAACDRAMSAGRSPPAGSATCRKTSQSIPRCRSRLPISSRSLAQRRPVCLGVDAQRSASRSPACWIGVGLPGLGDRPLAVLSGGGAAPRAARPCTGCGPELLILDEPTRRPRRQRRRILDDILLTSKHGGRTTVLMVSHDAGAGPARRRSCDRARSARRSRRRCRHSRDRRREELLPLDPRTAEGAPHDRVLRMDRRAWRSAACCRPIFSIRFSCAGSCACSCWRRSSAGVSHPGASRGAWRFFSAALGQAARSPASRSACCLASR